MTDLSLRGLLLFSLPSIFSSLLEPLSGVVDTALVGKLNTDWLAALAICSIILSSFTWMFNFLIHASTQAVATAVGDGGEGVPEKTRVSLMLSLCVGLISALGLYLFRSPLYVFSGASPELIPLVDSYFSIRLLGHPLTLFYMTAISVLRGLEKVNLSFFLVFISTALNIIMSWAFLYIFDWGLEGAAYGTVLANCIGGGLSFLFIYRAPQIRGKLFLKQTEKGTWLKFGKNAKEIFLRSAALTGCFYASTKMAASLGVISLAAHQILIQLWLICSFFIDGLAITGNVLGARLKAKKDKQGLFLLWKNLLILGAVIGLLFSLVYYFGNQRIWKLFTEDQQVIQILAEVWPLIFMSQILLSLAYVYDGLLFGLEEFAYLRSHMLVGVFLIFAPISSALYYYENLLPLWWGLILLGVYRFFSGHRRMGQLLGGMS